MSDLARCELLPCPFCGKSAKLRFNEWKGRPDIHWVECETKGCPGRPGHHGDSPELAIDAWNTRAQLARRDEVEPVACPECGAPCTHEVMMRGGDYGWSTTDEQRSVYRYTAPKRDDAAGVVAKVSGYESIVRQFAEPEYRLRTIIMEQDAPVLACGQPLYATALGGGEGFVVDWLPVCGSEAWAVIRPEGTVELVSIRASERAAQWAIGDWNKMEPQGFRCIRIQIAEHKP